MVVKEVVFENRIRKITTGDEEEQWTVELKEPEKGTTKKRQKAKYSTINADIAAHIYAYLNSFHVPNFFVKKLSDNSYLAKKITQIPIRTVVYNVAVGHLVSDFGAEEGINLDSPILEFFKTDKNGNELMINEYHAMAFSMANAEEFRMMGRMATKINAILKSFFSRRGLTLVRFSCQFGLDNGHLTLTSEIDMNSCSFIDPNSKKEKDIYREEKGNLDKAYTDLKNRVLK